MNQIKAIRERLGLTQAKFGAGIGCSQNNVSLYERGQSAPPEAAKSIINFASARGLPITFDHVYGTAALPELAESKAGR